MGLVTSIPPRSFISRLTWNAFAGPAGVERGQLVGAVADDGHALGLEVFKRQTEVENGLRTGADDHNGGFGKLLEVGGNIHCDFCAAMHTADAAGGKNLNACHRRDHHGRGDSRRAVRSLGNQHGKIPPARFGNAAAGTGKIVDLGFGKPCLEPTAEDGDGRRNSAEIADDPLDLERRVAVLRIRHAVGNDGRFERHDGSARVKRALDLGRNVKIPVALHKATSCFKKSMLFLLCPQLKNRSERAVFSTCGASHRDLSREALFSYSLIRYCKTAKRKSQ